MDSHSSKLRESWRRKWQPSPVFLPGKSHGQRSLVGYSPWGHKESDMTEKLHFLSLVKFKLDIGQAFTKFKLSLNFVQPFDGGHHFLHYPHHSLASGQTTGREHSPTNQQNWIKDFLSMDLPIRTRQVFPSVSLSHQETSISLLSFSIIGQREWKPQSQKIKKSDNMNHSLV